MSQQYCYILACPTNNKTYNGYTVNPYRRLRQHNQEIKGGAKYTKINGNKNWEMFVLITGFPDSQNALQCEWRIKHPNKKRNVAKKYQTPQGKIKGLNEILRDDQWTAFTTVTNETLILTIWIVEKYAALLDLTDIKPTVNVVVVNSLDLETLSIITIPDIINDVNNVNDINDEDNDNFIEM
jgi:predicted GIY-YIG superfamily endonuclease